MKSDLREFLDGWLEAARWSTTAEQIDPGCTCGAGKDRAADCAECELQPVEQDDLDLAEGEARDLCLPAARWYRRHWAILNIAAELRGNGWAETGWERVGHDAWLSSAGHGVGFWDRRELEVCSIHPAGEDACVCGCGAPELGVVLTALSKELGAEHSNAWIEKDEDGETVVRFETATLTGTGKVTCV